MPTDEEFNKHPYSIDQLKVLIASSARLGFYDDSIHWQNELNKLLNEEMSL